MISEVENEEVEMTDKMIERADELDNAVYDMLLTALQLDGAEAEEEFHGISQLSGKFWALYAPCWQGKENRSAIPISVMAATAVRSANAAAGNADVRQASWSGNASWGVSVKQCS